MTPEERDRVMAQLLAIWPNPTMGDATRIVWNDFITSLSAQRSMNALKTLQRTSRHRPAQSDFYECYAAEPSDSRALPRPECFVCEDGWVHVTGVTRSGLGRCPNGCLPPTHDELHERRMAEERQWDIDNANRRAGVQG